MRVIRWAAVGLVILGSGACVSSPDDPPPPGLCLTGQERLFSRYEGLGEANQCASDDQCVVGGCSGEVCAAVTVASTCEVIPTPRTDFGCRRCACIQRTCQWAR